MNGWHIDTRCVQEGWKPGNGEPRVVPIVQSTTFRYESAEALGDLFDLKTSGDFYTRLSNPTTGAVEAKIAALEGGVGALLTSPGRETISSAPARCMAAPSICSIGRCGRWAWM